MKRYLLYVQGIRESAMKRHLRMESRPEWRNSLRIYELTGNGTLLSFLRKIGLFSPTSALLLLLFLGGCPRALELEPSTLDLVSAPYLASWGPAEESYESWGATESAVTWLWRTVGFGVVFLTHVDNATVASDGWQVECEYIYPPGGFPAGW